MGVIETDVAGLLDYATMIKEFSRPMVEPTIYLNSKTYQHLLKKLVSPKDLDMGYNVPPDFATLHGLHFEIDQSLEDYVLNIGIKYKINK